MPVSSESFASKIGEVPTVAPFLKSRSFIKSSITGGVLSTIGFLLSPPILTLVEYPPASYTPLSA